MCIPKLIVLGLALLAVAIAVFIVLGAAARDLQDPVPRPAPLRRRLSALGDRRRHHRHRLAALRACLSLPAIWQGAGIARALAQTFAIVRSRLVEALLLLVLLRPDLLRGRPDRLRRADGGLMPTLGLSLSIVGFGGISSEEMLAMAQGYALGGHAVAGLFGGLLLWAVAGSLVGQVYLLGLSLVYLRVTEGLDLSASEAALRAAFEDAKRRTAGLGARRARDGPCAVLLRCRAVGRFRAQRQRAPLPPITSGDDRRHHDARGDPARAADAHGHRHRPAARHHASPRQRRRRRIGAPPAWQPPRAAAPLPGALPPAPPLPAITTCPQCLSSVTPDDAFCGVCGYRLK